MLDRFRARARRPRSAGPQPCAGSIAHEDGRLSLALAGGVPDPAFANGTPAPTRPGPQADAMVLALPPNRAAAGAAGGLARRRTPGLAPLDAVRLQPPSSTCICTGTAPSWTRTSSPCWTRPCSTSSIAAAFVTPESNPDASNSSARNSGADGSQWLDVSLSGAHTQAAQPQADIADAAIAGLRRAFPKARISEVRRWRVVKELQATFRPSPGIAARRPGPTTGVRNLFLAGAWTDTQWPATMESAVRSGHTAAAACRRGLAP